MEEQRPDKQINFNTAVEYWSSVPATVDGVLGGFGEHTVVPKTDIAGSRAFIRRLQSLSPKTFPNEPISNDEKLALDVGSGIGRVTKELLSHYASNVDIMEPAGPLIEQAKQNLSSISSTSDFYHVGIQDFVFTKKYWLIWCQWCLGQVPDDVLVEFFEKCKENLQQGGLIIVKENNGQDEDVFDEQDSSVTRADKNYRKLFERAGLRLLLTSLQRGMPKDLYPIRMYALAPKI